MRFMLFLLLISISMHGQFSEEFKASIQERVDNEYAPSIAVGIIDFNGTHFYFYGKTKNENGKVNSFILEQNNYKQEAKRVKE
jgi:hypothetical protein